MSVCLRQTSAYGRFKMQCFYVAGTTSKCPLMGGYKCSVCMWLGSQLTVSLQKVSISRGSSV